MDNTQILSPKPSIDEALGFLRMSDMEKAMGIQALLRISEHDALPLFFDEHLVCVSTLVKYGDQFDEEGGFVETLLIDPADVREFLSEHILDSFQLYKSSENSFELIVSKIIHDGTSYHISQSDGTLSEGVSVGYEKFYFDRKQLIEYKTEYSKHFSQRKEVKGTSSNRVSIQEQRIAAFKYWLVGNSGWSIHNPDDLKACYQELGSPTRDYVWSQLQLMDKDLFAHGKDNFKKEMSNVIEFKAGTGKDRTP